MLERIAHKRMSMKQGLAGRLEKAGKGAMPRLLKAVNQQKARNGFAPFQRFAGFPSLALR
jgi:hypothetical protein